MEKVSYIISFYPWRFQDQIWFKTYRVVLVNIRIFWEVKIVPLLCQQRYYL